MVRPYLVVAMGAALTLADPLLLVVGGDLLLQLPELHLHLGYCYLGVKVNDGLTSCDENDCSRLVMFKISILLSRSYVWPTDLVLHCQGLSMREYVQQARSLWMRKGIVPT